MLNLDTNIVVFFLTNRLTREEAAALENDPHWAISDIVLWELSHLELQQRFTFSLNDGDAATLLTRLTVLPITLEIARQSRRLDVAEDPADQLIAATSIVHSAPLVTRDSLMLASKLVPLAVRWAGGRVRPTSSC